MKLLRSLIFHQYFLSVEFFRGPHLAHFWWNSWEVWSFVDIFWVWIFQRSKLSTFPMKPLRKSVFHRYFLSVNFLEVHTQYFFDEPFEKFGLSSIFSKSVIFQRSIFWIFSMNALRSLVFHQYFSSLEFFGGPHLVHFFDETLDEFGLSLVFSKCWIFERFIFSTFSMKLLRSLIFHQYFLSVEFFRGPHLAHFWWNSWEVWSFVDIFWVWIFQRSKLSTFPMKPLRKSVFHRYFLSVNFLEVHT